MRLDGVWQMKRRGPPPRALRRNHRSNGAQGALPSGRPPTRSHAASNPWCNVVERGSGIKDSVGGKGGGGGGGWGGGGGGGGVGGGGVGAAARVLQSAQDCLSGIFTPTGPRRSCRGWRDGKIFGHGPGRELYRPVRRQRLKPLVLRSRVS